MGVIFFFSCVIDAAVRSIISACYRLVLSMTHLTATQSEAAHAEAAAHTPNARVSADGAPSHYGRYDLLGELGKGVRSVVYRAVERGSGREVALKIIKIRGSSIERQRVRREVEVRTLWSRANGL